MLKISDMGGDDDKPFACPTPGCGMRFTNEDHLTVHKQKHEMKLTLNASTAKNTITNVYVADQTPTPTKFLKNCEEIGLFQELSKNPFEEAFKKAAEHVPLPGPSLEGPQEILDTPTPHIRTLVTADSTDLPSITIHDIDTPTVDLPVTPAVPSVTPVPSSTTSDDDVTVTTSEAAVEIQEGPMTEVASSSTPNDLTIEASPVQMTIEASPVQTMTTTPTNPPPQKQQHRITNQSPTITSTKKSNANTGAYTVQMLVQLPNGQTMPISFPANAVPGVVSSTTPASVAGATATVAGTSAKSPARSVSSSTSALTKQRLKATLVQNAQHSLLGHVVKSIKPEMNGSRGNLATTSRSVSIDSNFTDDLEEIHSMKRKRMTESDDPDERRRKFLERNRAAAARCRHKRKAWITNLEKKSDDLQGFNQGLQAEISVLKSEISQLKAMLLAHKDCPVTRQQQAAGQLNIDSLLESGSETMDGEEDDCVSVSSPMSLTMETVPQTTPRPCVNVPINNKLPLVINNVTTTKGIAGLTSNGASGSTRGGVGAPMTLLPTKNVLQTLVSTQTAGLPVAAPTYIIVTNPAVSASAINAATQQT
ncbi:cyclic AMP-dependent transcription factor ATF-2-like [Tubulanus polymorphus]|uniref:cyclic AMP-dependent transcription factor ATF-2-like n=1 Tax=Tubulanus polymorphus TaxID=672921 RepID=UPI003DA34484